MYISKKKIFSFIIYGIFGLLIFSSTILIRDNSLQNWIDIISVILLTLIFIQYFIMKKLNLGIFSFIGIFLMFTYLFHFGNVILLSSPLKSIGLGSFVVNVVGPEYFKDAVIYCLYFVYILFWGVIFATKSKNVKKFYLNEEIEASNLMMSRFLGKVLFIFGVPVFLYISFSKLNASFTGDYLDTFEVQQSIPSFLNFLSTMMNVGICLLLIGYKNNLRVARGILLISIFLQIISMFSGSRGIAVIAIVLYLFVYIKIVNKVKLKNIITYLVIGYIGLALISSIRSIRDFGMDLGKIIEEFIVKLTNENLLLTTLNEFGGTLLTPAVAIQSVPNNVDPGYGLTYVNSVANLIGVNIGEIEIGSFVELINIGAMGGSYIGEAYYNFLNLGWLVAFIIGFLICKVSNKIDLYIYIKDYLKIGYYFPLLIAAFWWVRDSFNYFARISIAGALFYYILIVTTKFILIKYKYPNKKYGKSLY